MEYNLDPIFEYNMNEEETLAYKIGLLWMAISSKTFPNYKFITSFPKKGDPRKSSLFKYCYKMQKETKGIIDAKEYKLYIAAQLQILKSIEIGNTHPHIGPWCLVGDKAWVRWKVWKKKFDNIGKSKNLKEVGLDKANIEEVKTELNKTKKFLMNKFNTENDFKNKTKDLERWASLGMINGFYVVMSPWFNKYCKPGDIDLTYYQASVNEEVINIFKTIFPDES